MQELPWSSLTSLHVSLAHQNKIYNASSAPFSSGREHKLIIVSVVARSKLEINVQTMCKGGKPSTAARTPIRMCLSLSLCLFVGLWVGIDRAIDQSMKTAKCCPPLLCLCQGSSPSSSYWFCVSLTVSLRLKPPPATNQPSRNWLRSEMLHCLISLFYTLSAKLSFKDCLYTLYSRETN